jgi:hypothetical protein
MPKPKPPTDDALAALRATLLRNVPPRVLPPDHGDEAFQSHKLLSGEVLRASKLDQTQSESETDAFVRYVTTYYPAGRGRGDAATARLLFTDWRTSLTKLDAPGARVPITQSQPLLHWQRDQEGRVCLNLEDAWADFVFSVGEFVDFVSQSARHKIILKRAREHDWHVTSFKPVGLAQALAGATVMDMEASGASFGISRTTISISTGGARSVTAHGPDDS